MNTPFDTMETGDKYFPDRTSSYLSMYSTLLNKMLMEPDTTLQRTIPTHNYVYFGGILLVFLLLVYRIIVLIKRKD